MRALRLSLVGVLAASSAGGCRTDSAAAAVQEPATVIAFVGVNTVTMTDSIVRRAQTVIVDHGRIAQIGDSARIGVPAGATIIRGNGRYLVPSLIDMHVHLSRADLPAYLRAGIGRVRNMWGHPGITTLIRGVDDGSIIGPTIHSVSSGVDGADVRWPFTRQVLDPRIADSVVGSLAAEGWTTIKVYQSLTLSVYDSVVAAVKRRGLTFVGHVPTAVPIAHALEAGQRSIEHFTGYDQALSRTRRIGTWGWSDVDTTRFAALVRATVAAGTWNCPTLAIYVKLSEQNAAADRPLIIENRRRFVQALSRGGALLLAGTDAGIDVVPPGTTLHVELAEFVAAGLSRYEALRAATVDAGRFLGVRGAGTISVGAPADLLLTNANPLSDLATLEGFEGMALRGIWLTRAQLAALR